MLLRRTRRWLLRSFRRYSARRSRCLPPLNWETSTASGSVTGPRLSGVVLPGGGDWQAIHEDGLTEIFARYSLKANDGTVIAVSNPGVRVASPDIIKRLAAGEDVDPSLYYFRTTPTFDVAAGPHDWLRRKVFVARGIRRPDHVLIDFFQVD
jgi:Protein of unknown function (DUF3237)